MTRQPHKALFKAHELPPPTLSAIVGRTGWGMFAVCSLALAWTAALAGMIATHIADSQVTRNIATTTATWQIFIQAALITSSAALTIAASTGFSRRYDAITETVKELSAVLSARCQDQSWVPREDDEALFLVRVEVCDPSMNGSAMASNIRATVSGSLLPSPYDRVDHLSLTWELPDYLELLKAERSVARSQAGKLAASLAGLFAGNVLASLRLVQALS